MDVNFKNAGMGTPGPENLEVNAVLWPQVGWVQESTCGFI